jgi:hypothetical protein
MVWVPGIILGLLTAPQAFSAGLRSVADGWLLNGGDTARVLWSGETPTGSPASDSGFGLWAAVGQTHLYGMEVLPVTCLALGAADNSGRWKVALTWERLGADLLVEDDFLTAFRTGRHPRLGLQLRVRRWVVSQYPPQNHLDPALEVGWSGQGALGWWDLTLLWHPLDPAPWLGQRGRRPLALVKVASRGWGLAVALDLDAGGTPHGEFMGLAHLGPGVAVGIRSDPTTGSLGPVFAFQSRGFLLRTCHTVHPVLGVTHRLTLGFGNAEAAPW